MIQSFRDLRAYQKAREETRRIYEISKQFLNIGGMLNRMIERTDAFCASAKRQSP